MTLKRSVFPVYADLGWARIKMVIKMPRPDESRSPVILIVSARAPALSALEMATWEEVVWLARNRLRKAKWRAVSPADALCQLLVEARMVKTYEEAAAGIAVAALGEA